MVMVSHSPSFFNDSAPAQRRQCEEFILAQESLSHKSGRALRCGLYEADMSPEAAPQGEMLSA